MFLATGAYKEQVRAFIEQIGNILNRYGKIWIYFNNIGFLFLITLSLRNFLIGDFDEFYNLLK